MGKTTRLPSPGQCAPHSDRVLVLTPSLFPSLFPVTPTEGLRERLSPVLHQSEELSPRKGRRHARQALSQPRLRHAGTTPPCLRDAIGSRTQCHPLLHTCFSWAPLKRMKRKLRQRCSLFGAKGNVSAGRAQLPAKTINQTGHFCPPPLPEQVRNGGKQSPLSQDKGGSLPLSYLPFIF